MSDIGIMLRRISDELSPFNDISDAIKREFNRQERRNKKSLKGYNEKVFKAKKKPWESRKFYG